MRFLNRLLASIRPRTYHITHNVTHQHPPAPIEVGVIPDGYQVVITCPPNMRLEHFERIKTEFAAAREAHARGEKRACVIWGDVRIYGIPKL